MRVKKIEKWYEYIYDKDELLLYQDFKMDYYRKVKDILNWGHLLRYFEIAILIFCVALNAYAWETVWHLFKYLSSYNVFITIASIWCSAVVTQEEKLKE